VIVFALGYRRHALATKISLFCQPDYFNEKKGQFISPHHVFTKMLTSGMMVSFQDVGLFEIQQSLLARTARYLRLIIIAAVMKDERWKTATTNW
jgi:hypothetical protein